MSDINPYASPTAPLDPPPVILEPTDTDEAIYRDGRLLVMHRNAVLPDVCIKSNQPAHGRRLRRRLYWHHPAIYLTILIHVLIYIIVALVIRKHAVIQIGLSKEWFGRRRRAIAVGWLLAVAGIAIVVGSSCFLDDRLHPSLALGIPAGFFLFITGAIYGVLASRMVATTRITDEYIWLKGICPEFLLGLPPWPNPGGERPVSPFDSPLARS
jgi:hypothetical protein